MYVLEIKSKIKIKQGTINSFHNIYMIDRKAHLNHSIVNKPKKLGMMVHACNCSTHSQEFKILLSYLKSSRPAYLRLHLRSKYWGLVRWLSG